MSLVSQDEFYIPSVKRTQNNSSARRKSETELLRSKLIIPSHHLEPKSTLSIRQSDVKTGPLLLAKNVNFFRRPREYWFVLNCDHSFFTYYKSRQEYMMGSNSCGTIDIKKCSVVIDPENRGQFTITETRFRSFKLIANNDNERNSWVQALQLQRAYWNKSKRSKEKLLQQQQQQLQLSLSDTHTQSVSHQRHASMERGLLSPTSLRKSFFKQNTTSFEENIQRSSSLNRTSSFRPFTISFRASPTARRTFFNRRKSGSVENMQFIKPVEAATSDIPSPIELPTTLSPLSILQKDLTRSISFDTVRKPSPTMSPLMGSRNAIDNGLVLDSKGEVFVKYSGGHFLDEDLSDEEIACDYGNQPSTLIGAQLIIRNCQGDLREANREIERLKSREQGYKDLLSHRDEQLIELGEQIEEGALGKTSTRQFKRDSSTAASRMARRIEELNNQLAQQKRVEEIMYTELQNLEKSLFKREAELQITNDRYEETKKTLRLQRDRHLSLIGYAMTHILGNRHMIISEHMRDGGQIEIPQYSLEERLHHDVTWLWRYCRSEDNELQDYANGGTVEDKFGDTLEPSQEDPSSVLDSVRYLSEHLSCQSSYLNNLHHIPFKEKKEMKRLVRKGLPDSIRKSVWSHAIRLQVSIIRKGQPKNIYEQLVNEASTSKSSFTKDIDLDLYRTFPGNVYFRNQDKSLVPVLRRILLAYSVFDPKIGYCQGMNMLAGIALCVLPEEESFWCLVAILQKLMVENYYSGSLLGAIADQMVLSDLIKERLPKLSYHMEKYGIEPHLICLNWFITIFADVMPTHQVLKIWDTFLLDGRKTIFRYTLAILHLHEENLMQKDDPILLHNYIRLVCAHWIDFDLLRHIAFTKFKSIPKTSRLDELHRVHLLPLTVEHEKRESKKRKKVTLPVSHSVFLMPQSASYSPVVQRPSSESKKIRDERKWECGTNLLTVNQGLLLCAGESAQSSMYLCRPVDDSDEYSCTPLDLEIGSTVYCMVEVGPFWILGTSNGWLYGIDKVTQQMLWKSELKETPLCFYVPNREGVENQNNRLYLGLASGKLHSFTLQGLPTALQDGLMLPELFPADTVVVGLGNEPISCLESPGEGMLCCGVGGRICVFETESTQQLYDMIVSSEKRRSIREMRCSRFGLWVSLKGSCNLLLYQIQSNSHSLIHKFDYSPHIIPSLNDCQILNNSTLPQTSKDNRLTTMLVRSKELWIGTHKGTLLIFKIDKEKKDILTSTQIVEITISMEKESVFGLADEVPLSFLPKSGEKQELTTVKLLAIEKVSEYPIRVLLDCGDLGVLTAAGSVGNTNSVRLWKRDQITKLYTSYNVPFTSPILPPNTLVSSNLATPQVDNIIGFGCENSLKFSQNSFAPKGEFGNVAPLSPIHENQVNGFADST